jgi:hypothetical protein
MIMVFLGYVARCFDVGYYPRLECQIQRELRNHRVVFTIQAFRVQITAPPTNRFEKNVTPQRSLELEDNETKFNRHAMEISDSRFPDRRLLSSFGLDERVTIFSLGLR